MANFFRIPCCRFPYPKIQKVVLRLFLGILGVLSAAVVGSAQKPATDSVVVLLERIKQFQQAGSDELALEAAGATQQYLGAHPAVFTAEALQLLADVYQYADAGQAVETLLGETGTAAAAIPNLPQRRALLEAALSICEKWNLPALKAAMEDKLAAVRDSAAHRLLRAEKAELQNRLDSLLGLQRLAEESAATNYTFSPEALMAWGMGILLLLCVGWVRVSRRIRAQRKQSRKIANENDMLRSKILQLTTLSPITPDMDLPHFATPPTDKNPPPSILLKTPLQTALLLIPNQPARLYFESVLASVYKTETASTATEGIQMAENLLPDLIICDTDLPDQSGIAVVRELKISPNTRHLPVVLLSAHHGPEGKLEALRAGADDWFTHPVRDAAIRQAVDALNQAVVVRHQRFNRWLQSYYKDNRFPPEDPFMGQVMDCLDKNLEDVDYSVDEIAPRLGVSKLHFVRRVKALTGREPAQLLREMRLEKGRVLLEQRAGTPASVAAKVGFSSTGAFAAAFRELFGETDLL
jgi:CheY-like chemotaxis protein/AraC-like DNA-binding protein